LVSILQEHAKRLHVGLSNEFRIGITASDIDETLPMAENALLKASGRCHATVNAQIPPRSDVADNLMQGTLWDALGRAAGCKLQEMPLRRRLFSQSVPQP
jgi:hypothetical protein